MAHEPIELCGGPADGTRVPVPEGTTRFAVRVRGAEIPLGAATFDGDLFAGFAGSTGRASLIPTREVCYRRAGRTTAEGLAAFEVEG